MKNSYQQTTIKGFKVEVFTGYDGVQLFITDANNVQIYAHRVSGDPIERAHEVIVRETAAIETVQSAKMVCFTEREQEFYNAVTRAQEGDLEVFEDFEINHFVVKNFENDHEYRVRLEIAEGKVYGECECADYKFRRRICKHISKVLAKRLTPAVFA